MKEAIAANDMDRIKNGKDELQKTMYEVSGKMYQQAAPQGDPNAAQQPGGDPNQGGAKRQRLRR